MKFGAGCSDIFILNSGIRLVPIANRRGSKSPRRPTRSKNDDARGLSPELERLGHLGCEARCHKSWDFVLLLLPVKCICKHAPLFHFKPALLICDINSSFHTDPNIHFVLNNFHLVPGGNRGIGYAAVAAFWKLRDFHTIIACRNPKLGEEAAQVLRATDGGGLIEVMRSASYKRTFFCQG